MEAVETAEDAEMLRRLGIDYAQGYFFLEPLPGRELAQLLRSGESADHSDLLEPLGAAPTSLDSAKTGPRSFVLYEVSASRRAHSQIEISIFL